MVGGDRRSPPRHKAKGGGGKELGCGSNDSLGRGSKGSCKSGGVKPAEEDFEEFKFGSSSASEKSKSSTDLVGNTQISANIALDLGNGVHCDSLENSESVGMPTVITGNGVLKSWAMQVEDLEDQNRALLGVGHDRNMEKEPCVDGLACRVESRSLCKSHILAGYPSTMGDPSTSMLIEAKRTAADGNCGLGTGMECDGLIPTAAISYGDVCKNVDYVNHNMEGCKVANSGKIGDADSTGIQGTSSCTQGVCSLVTTEQFAENAENPYVKTGFMSAGTSAICGIAASNGQKTATNLQKWQVKKNWNSPMVPNRTEHTKQVGNYGLNLKTAAGLKLPNAHPTNAWKRNGHLKVNTMELGTITNNGRSVSFDEAAYERNKGRLENGLIGKLFGRKLPLHILDQELSRRWSHVGGFRTILLGGDCFLCVFESMEARDNILMGGPWQIMGQLIGMEKWSPEFNPELLTGFSSPVWVRFPKLPLLYWDNITIARIASMIGEPLWIDAQTIEWGRCEYARVCIRLDLSKSLPTGIWIQGKQAEFFQAVEYEGISLLCFHCGVIGHKAEVCRNMKMVTSSRNVATIKTTTADANDGTMEGSNPSPVVGDYSSTDRITGQKTLPCMGGLIQQVPVTHDSTTFVDQEDAKKYGPWILVSRKRKSQPKSGKKFTPKMIGKPVISQTTNQAEVILERQQEKVPEIDEQLESNVDDSAALLPTQQMDVAGVELVKTTDASLTSSSRKGKSRISKAHFEKELLQLGPIALKSRKRKKKVTIAEAEQCLKDFTQASNSGGGDASPSRGK